jgi:hypothetical protein
MQAMMQSAVALAANQRGATKSLPERGQTDQLDRSAERETVPSRER